MLQALANLVTKIIIPVILIAGLLKYKTLK